MGTKGGDWQKGGLSRPNLCGPNRKPEEVFSGVAHKTYHKCPLHSLVLPLEHRLLSTGTKPLLLKQL
eukprot:3919825-Amphidinium_carterae.1